jgi:hypothetical protein
VNPMVHRRLNSTHSPEQALHDTKSW